MLKFQLGSLNDVIRLISDAMVEKFYDDKGNMTKSVPVRFPVKIAYWLDNALEKFQSENQKFDKQRIKLCEKYCDKDKDDKPIMYKRRLQESDPYEVSDNPEDAQYKIIDGASWAKEYNDLAQVEIEIPFTTFTLEDLGDIRLTVNDIAVFKGFGFMELTEEEKKEIEEAKKKAEEEVKETEKANSKKEVKTEEGD